MHRRQWRGREGGDWRWKLAHLALPAATFPGRAWSDELTRDARAFLQLCNRGEHDRARKHFPFIAAARSLNADETLCETLKILTIGNCDVGEIAQRTGLESEVVETWERLFRDVRDPNGTGESWVFHRVYFPEEQRGNYAFSVKLRYAYIGGPAAARAILDAASHAPVAEGARLCDKFRALHLKLDAAASLPFENSRQAFALLRRSLSHQLQIRRLENQRQALINKSIRAIADARCATLREEARLLRARARASERRRRQDEREQIRAAEATRRQILEEHAARSTSEWVATSPLAELTWSVEPEPELLRDILPIGIPLEECWFNEVAGEGIPAPAGDNRPETAAAG